MVLDTRDLASLLELNADTDPGPFEPGASFVDVRQLAGVPPRRWLPTDPTAESRAPRCAPSSYGGTNDFGPIQRWRPPA